MLHPKAEWPSKQNILIADTILAEPGPYPGSYVLGRQNTFLGEKSFCFYHMFKTILSEHNKIGGTQTRFGGNSPRMPHPVSAGLGRTVTRKCSIHWGPLFLCSGVRHSENVYLIQNMNSICRLCKLTINIFPKIHIIGS